MNTVMKEAVRKLATWERVPYLPESNDPVQAILNHETKTRANYKLKRLARIAANTVLFELTRRKYEPHKNAQTAAEKIAAKYKGVAFESIRGEDPTKLRMELSQLIARVNEERSKLGLRVNELGYYGIESEGIWYEITSFEDALELFELMNKEKFEN